MMRISVFKIIWKIRYRFRKDEVFEFIGNWVLIMVRNIVNDKNIVIEYDIFFFVFVGIINVSIFIKLR